MHTTYSKDQTTTLHYVLIVHLSDSTAGQIPGAGILDSEKVRIPSLYDSTMNHFINKQRLQLNSTYSKDEITAVHDILIAETPPRAGVMNVF